ncbi:MAG: hypothetical protein AAFN30_08475, partial [Actinomycetota bacterium]
VRLSYGRTVVDWLGILATVVGLLGLIVLWRLDRTGRRPLVATAVADRAALAEPDDGHGLWSGEGLDSQGDRDLSDWLTEADYEPTLVPVGPTSDGTNGEARHRSGDGPVRPAGGGIPPSIINGDGPGRDPVPAGALEPDPDPHLEEFGGGDIDTTGDGAGKSTSPVGDPVNGDAADENPVDGDGADQDPGDGDAAEQDPADEGPIEAETADQDAADQDAADRDAADRDAAGEDSLDADGADNSADESGIAAKARLSTEIGPKRHREP